MTNALTSEKFILSASRRTDIPAFYMPWFMAGIEQGEFEVVNPYNRKISKVPAGADRVHSIVFWSKNFGPFLKGAYGEELLSRGYNLFFNFSVNSASALLEPRVPGLPARLEQMAALCRRFGSRAVNWRFDPLCFYTTGPSGEADNLKDFERIADTAGRLGIRRCVTSFMDDYAKIRKRTAAISGFKFVNPPLEKKVSVCLEMEKILAPSGIRLQTCCEKEVLEALPAGSGIQKGGCIPADLLMTLFGGRVSLQKDSGQRIAAGCGCHLSRDIGSYERHPCYHNCLFCYANPRSERQVIG